MRPHGFLAETYRRNPELALGPRMSLREAAVWLVVTAVVVAVLEVVG